MSQITILLVDDHAIGHGLEGDFNRKGSSAFSNKVGTQVAAKKTIKNQ